MANFKNIIGTGFPKYVTDQLEARKKLVSKTTRDSKDLLWLSNRTGWFRMTSGALEPKKNEQLAKNYILQGGLASRKGGFSDSYIKGPLGFKPMPGITSLSVSTGGRWQTLLQGEVEFIAYDLDQLDILSRLYMSLGVHVFIEWGHKPYIKNNVVDTSKDTNPIDFFSFPKNANGAIALQQKVNSKKKTLEGNYGALVGRVYNFDYNANPDGSYTCKIKVMGPAALADALRISKKKGPNNDPTPDESPEKDGSDLANALISIKNTILTLLDPQNKGGVGELKGVDEPANKKETALNWLGNKIGGQKNEFGDGYYTQPSYSQILTKIYKNCNYPGPTFNTGVSYNGNSFQEFGNAHQIINQINGANNDNLQALDYSFYKGYASSLTYQKTGWFGSNTINPTYITLGHLFCLVQHLGIFVETSGEPQPAVYLDYHPDNTVVNTGAIEASIDPSICLIPFQPSPVGLFEFLSPLDVQNPETWEGQKGTKTNADKYFPNTKKDKVTNFISKRFAGDNIGDGKIFNVLINIDFALNTLSSIENNKEDKVANLREYLQKILDGVNKALGKNNSFKIVSDECGLILRVIDENYIPPSIEYMTLPPFGKESIAYDYSYSSKISKNLASQIVIASQATGEDLKDLSEDVLSYFKLNGGISDRFSSVIKDAYKEDKEGKDLSKFKSPQNLFDQLVKTYTISDKDPINVGVGDTLVNYYATLQQQLTNKTCGALGGKFTGGVLIPLEMSITIDGMTGILPYNAFLLPNNRLPKRYRNRVAFIVFSINHTFDNNQWKTTLRGQTIIRPEQSY